MGVRHEAAEAGKIAGEHTVFPHAVLQAPQIGIQFRRTFFGQAIDDPIAVSLRSHQSPDSKVAEVFGYLGLRFAENLLKTADAKRALTQQI
jgi:hypothetical protein